MESTSLIPECWADTLLIETLGFKKPNHKMGIGEVVNVMQKTYKNKIAVGVIDRDKKMPSHVKKFKEIKSENGLYLKQMKGTNHYLIIHPPLENWLEEIGNSCKMKVPYGNKVKFRKKMKDKNIHKDKKIVAFFNDLKQKNPKEFKTIKSWIDNIRNK